MLVEGAFNPFNFPSITGDEQLVDFPNIPPSIIRENEISNCGVTSLPERNAIPKGWNLSFYPRMRSCLKRGVVTDLPSTQTLQVGACPEKALAPKGDIGFSREYPRMKWKCSSKNLGNQKIWLMEDSPHFFHEKCVVKAPYTANTQASMTFGLMKCFLGLPMDPLLTRVAPEEPDYHGIQFVYNSSRDGKN